MEAYRIILADDHYLIRNGIKTIIDQQAGLEVIAEAADGQELIDILKMGQPPDMVILDISMPRISGIEALKQIHESYPDVRVLILTMHSNLQYCIHAFSAGAHGYLLKDDSATELLPAILQVRRGRKYVSPQLAGKILPESDKRIRLTPREREVLLLVLEGMTTREIAERLCISPRTVERHRSSILKRYKVRSTAELIKVCLKSSSSVSILY